MIITAFFQRVLPLVEDNLWQLNLVNNFNASLLFLPLIFLTGEADVVLGGHLNSVVTIQHMRYHEID